MNALEPTCGRGDGGFALVVLLGIIGVASMTIVLAVQSFVPPFAGRTNTANSRLATVQSAALVGYQRNGAFPATLNALATAGGLEQQGWWRIDPYGDGQDLDYALVAGGARARSRGLDRLLGTGDDVTFQFASESPLRDRQRARLRLLRAMLLRSAYRFDVSMSALDQTAMRSAMATTARVQRQWLTATAAERTALTTQWNAGVATIAGLRAAYTLPSLPAALTGAGGLMEQLGTLDSRAVDGAGAALRVDAVLGMAAVGADGAGATDDDM